jgi:hypothetical protein
VSRRTRNTLSAVVLVGLLLVVGWVISLGEDPPAIVVDGPPAPALAERRIVLSLLAVGDTGKVRPWRPFAEGQESVGRGMAAENARRPADALVLLGDLFYPAGLSSDELVFRVRHNLIRPFCTFTGLGAPRSAEVADACPVAPAARHPVPIYAVLGNHDAKSEESMTLLREAVPEFIDGWHLFEEPAHTVELGSGVSLVLVDSPAITKLGTAEAARRAIERAKGPWRIVAAHQPMAIREGGRWSGWAADMRRAVQEADRPVQLFISGHRHNLQLMTLEDPRPMVHVIAGGGTNRRPLDEPPFVGRHFAIPTTGFTRIDLVESGDDAFLEVSLFTVPRYPIHSWIGPTRVSRWRIDRDGRSAQVDPPVQKSASSTSASATTP